MSDLTKTPAPDGYPHPSGRGLDPAAADLSSTAAAERTQTPGEYVGEAESRESDLLAAIADRLITPWTDCQIWTGATDRGYGRISLGGTVYRVHRVAWELENGPIPDGLTIDHLCRVRACCNTAHMELVTVGENVRRAGPHHPRQLSNPRKKRTHCAEGHELTPENVYRSPSDPGYRQCRKCRAAKRRRRGRQGKAA